MLENPGGNETLMDIDTVATVITKKMSETQSPVKENDPTQSGADESPRSSKKKAKKSKTYKEDVDRSSVSPSSPEPKSPSIKSRDKTDKRKVDKTDRDTDRKMDFDADSVGSPVSIRSGDKKDKKKKDKKSRKDDETNFMESTEFKLTMQKLETGGPEAMTMQLVE